MRVARHSLWWRERADMSQSPIDRTGPCGYARPVIRFLSLAMLLCALIVPRAVWAEHVGQHDGVFSSSQDHVHHDDHVHKVAATDADHDHDAAADDDSDGETGLVHNHLPADLLSVWGEPETAPLVTDRLLLPEPQGAVRSTEGARSDPPNNLLRPPRTV
jgi:hypothetical protein